MRWLFVLVVVIFLNSDALAQNTADSKDKPRVMEVMLFLNTKALPPDAASVKADHEKKTLKYFDENGKLVKESYLGEHNDIVTKKYDKEGKVISEVKLTEKEVFSGKPKTKAVEKFSK